MRKDEPLNFELGDGIYDISEVAFILGLPKATVRLRMKAFWEGKRRNDHHLYLRGEGTYSMINFLTLVEFHVFYQLRSLDISTKKIIAAHNTIALQLNTAYPFASEQVLSENSLIFSALGDAKLIKDEEEKQTVFNETIGTFFKKLAFSKAGIADCFYPMGKSKHVVVSPNHQFGQPTIENTNILAEVVANLYHAGDSAKVLSRLYEIPANVVKDAITFFKPYRTA